MSLQVARQQGPVERLLIALAVPRGKGWALLSGWLQEETRRSI